MQWLQIKHKDFPPTHLYLVGNLDLSVYWVTTTFFFRFFSTSHYVKSVQIRSFSWSVFPCIRTEYGDLLRKSPYSVRIQENTDQKNSVFGHLTQ